ncbi:MAG: hypothetical protein AAF581_15840 [Planctomycetota bacterium]
MRVCTRSLFLGFSLLLSQLTFSQEATRSLAHLLPIDSAVVVELNDGTALLKGLADSGLEQRVLTSSVYRDYQSSDDSREVEQLLKVLRQQTKLTTRTLVQHVLAGQGALSMQFGGGRSTKLLFVSRLKHPKTVDKLVQIALTIAGENGSQRRVGSIHRFRVGGLRGCRSGDLLLLSQESRLIEEALARQNASGNPSETASLAKNARYQQLRGNDGSQLSVYFDAALIRKHRPAVAKLIEPRKNAGESILFGGYLRALGQCGALLASLDATATGLRIGATTDDTELPGSHSCFFPTKSILPPLVGPGQIGRLTLQRNPLAWWQQQGTLVTEAVRLNMQRFQTDIANVLGGADFDEQILPYLGNEAQLLFFTAQPATRRPEPLLPDMALVLPCTDKAEFADQLRVAFQTLISFTNIERMQNQERPLMLGADLYEGFPISYAKPLPPTADDALGVEYNFAVSMAVHKDRLIIGSNVAAARRAIDALRKTPHEGARRSGDSLFVDAGQLVELLVANRATLIAQGILEGKSAEEAAYEQHALQEIIGWFAGSQIDLHRQQERLALDAKLVVAAKQGDPDKQETAPKSPVNKGSF